jgi:hypothetical protein
MVSLMSFKEVTKPSLKFASIKTSKPSLLLVEIKQESISTRLQATTVRELKLTWEPRIMLLSCLMLIKMMQLMP